MSEPVGAGAARHVQRRVATRPLLAIGTLACPDCDAPVVPSRSPLTPTHPLSCGFCLHSGTVRDFLSLSEPTRPARVEVRVVQSRSPASTTSLR